LAHAALSIRGVGGASSLRPPSPERGGAGGGVQTAPIHVKLVGVAATGSEDHPPLVVSLAAGDWPFADGAAIRAPGDQAHVELAAERLRLLFPDASVHVLQRVAQADTQILDRLGSVFGLLGLIIVLAAGLCVSTTFSTMVSQRSREIGLQKALGASDAEVTSLLWGEAICLGSAGTLLGYLLGMGFAAWIGESVFGSVVPPPLVVFPFVVLVAVGMTLIAAIPAAHRIARIEPAISLKGSGKGLSRGE